MEIRKRFSRTTVLCAPLIAIAVVTLVGCGKPAIERAKVEGEVKYDGQIVENGLISFLPKDGHGPTDGADIKQGRYSVLVTPGEKKIEVRGMKSMGKKATPEDPDGSETFVDYIPTEYNTSTTLVREVKMPKTTIDFDLKPVAEKK